MEMALSYIELWKFSVERVSGVVMSVLMFIGGVGGLRGPAVC